MSALSIVLLGLVILLLAALAAAFVLLKGLIGSITTFETNGRKNKANNFKLLNESALPGQTVFVGDSITEMYPTAEMYADFAAESGQRIYNRGISGEVSGELLARFESNVAALRPRNLVMLIGTNDLSKSVAEETIVAQVEKALACLRKASPDCNIILEAVYPTNSEVVDKKLQLIAGSNSSLGKIRSLNCALKALSERTGAVWLDLTEQLADGKGLLKSEYTVDGVHLNVHGYRVVTAAVKPLLR